MTGRESHERLGAAPSNRPPIRLVIVQAGNYVEAYERFQEGGEETFYAQRYSVDFVDELARRPEIEDLVQICTSADLDETSLPNGIRQLGIEQWPAGGRDRTDELVATVLAQRPTHLISSSPTTPLIRAARKAGIDVLPLLADSFGVSGIKAKLRYWWLARNLSHPGIRWITNHNLKASQDLERIGIPAHKIVPFDWPPVVRPTDFPVKTGAAERDRPLLLYVGQVREPKGVGDLIDAVALARNDGSPFEAVIIGTGDTERFADHARAQGVDSDVDFAGRMAHGEVLRRMHESDVVVVPSHHEYPEGLPMTIYEGLCSRTPLVVSDHPMFSTRVHHGRDCLTFPARNPAALRDAIDRLVGDSALYASLSRAAEEACESFFVGAVWGELIEHWLGGTAQDDAWLADRALSSPRFQ